MLLDKLFGNIQFFKKKHAKGFCPSVCLKTVKLLEKDCKRAVENAGGFEVSLKKATDYLVIGNYATDSWIHSSYGRKIEKAMEMKQKGHHIKIISESHWVDFLD
jgi:NAD-dependent DNA ligase